MPHKAMGASSPMRDMPVVHCSNIFCALRHLWRARRSNTFGEGRGGGGLGWPMAASVRHFGPESQRTIFFDVDPLTMVGPMFYLWDF